MAKTFMVLGTLQGAAVSVAFVAGVSCGFNLLTGYMARVSAPAGHYFVAYHTATVWHQEPVQFAVMGLSEKSTCW